MEAGQKGDLYISETLIQRADDVFWVLNHDTMLLQEELDQLKKIHQMGKKPFFILNTSKYEDKIIEDFIASEKNATVISLKNLLVFPSNKRWRQKNPIICGFILIATLTSCILK